MNRHDKSVKMIELVYEAATVLGVTEHTYVVGGAVRDYLRGHRIKDIDIVIDSLACGVDSEKFAAQFTRLQPDATMVTNQYGVAIVTLNYGDMRGEVLEVANARGEKYDNQGYKPTETFPASLEVDAFRREFTVNTLMWRLSELPKGLDKIPVIDMTGRGIEDLLYRRLVCPSDPDRTFQNDPSRMIRTIKFGLRGFEITREVREAIKRNVAFLRNVPTSHLGKLLTEFVYEQGDNGVEMLNYLGLMDSVKGIIAGDRMLRETLDNAADRVPAALLFELQDANLPAGKRLNRVPQQYHGTVRGYLLGVSPEIGSRYLDLLYQPGQVLDMPKLIAEYKVSGREIRELQAAAQMAAIIHPECVSSSEAWEMKTRAYYRK